MKLDSRSHIGNGELEKAGFLKVPDKVKQLKLGHVFKIKKKTFPFNLSTNFQGFDKLIKRGVPNYLVRIHCYWFTNQKMSIRWGSIISDSFNVNNEVRQGRFLSPYLFNMYMDAWNYNLRKIIICSL